MVGVLAVLPLEPDSAEVLFLVACDSLWGAGSRAQLVAHEELVLCHIKDRPRAVEVLGDDVGAADGVLAGRHVHIDHLHGEPGHEDEE